LASKFVTAKRTIVVAVAAMPHTDEIDANCPVLNYISRLGKSIRPIVVLTKCDLMAPSSRNSARLSLLKADRTTWAGLALVGALLLTSHHTR
jgi:hypothetical protein